MTRPITIIGGGLAGLTLGIGLRQREVPVTVWEAGRYPRHRVCGEFISGEGLKVLDRLGLRRRLEAAGASPARTVLFVSGPNRSPVRELSDPALCLSRHTMDALLAEAFREAGGELRENTRWPRNDDQEGLVLAAGRRLQPTENGWRWFGVKAHVSATRGPELWADLEMHVTPSGYVGINRINDGQTNVCGLFRAGPGAAPAESREQPLRGRPGSTVYERLHSVEFDPGSFCSVAGLSLKPQRAISKTECCIGDALTMTPPVTGNGMSMAFESAAMAIEPLAAYSRTELSWREAGATIARRCDAAFKRRLAWARWLQWLMFSGLLGGTLGPALLGSDVLWRWMFERTR
jgi:2-polyprenyl-6-methoxyphenol hydroxylase-like FAD-dependent oxidoreductase